MPKPNADGSESSKPKAVKKLRRSSKLTHRRLVKVTQARIRDRSSGSGSGSGDCGFCGEETRCQGAISQERIGQPGATVERPRRPEARPSVPW